MDEALQPHPDQWAFLASVSPMSLAGLESPIQNATGGGHPLDARVALELDGPQHQADPVAYRRDRSKDRLLQQSGYFVLRFLAEDVGKELDSVLDSVLCTLAGRRS